MMIHANCRGFATAQHMQPEPAKYAHAPNLEARSFMQPEQPYYAHHPGRFVYIRDEDNGKIFSAPYEPVRRLPDDFEFSAGQTDIRWRTEIAGIEVLLCLALPTDKAVELWSIKICNRGKTKRRLSIYPFFTIGYMSWMNQSACYRRDLGGIVASSVTPYQRVEDYPAIKTLKDKTFLLHDQPPDAWETALEAFEGEGGLHNPDGLDLPLLAGGDALYETPAAILQYCLELSAGEQCEYRFLFGPARDDEEITGLREEYLCAGGFEKAKTAYESYISSGNGCISISTPDLVLDDFVNHWLARQVFYHGDVNRLCTDPQTRNYLQDAMGMVYIQPEVARAAFLKALSQQKPGGAMPDGIRLTEEAELKYINQVPHTDHCVWLPVCLQAYLDESGDFSLLDEPVTDESGHTRSVFERVTDALHWLLADRDERGLSLIAQGDWCDPMNMVGHKGKGVSAWLSIATVYAMRLWSDICLGTGRNELADEMQQHSQSMSDAIQKHFWDGRWFARGITDDDVLFGTQSDDEGRIFLNPQSWAMLAGICNGDQTAAMLQAIDENLLTPYGVMMLAPAFTGMREDIGRVTQKFPGSAENGSVYNHAAAFYGFALYQAGEADRAYQVIRRMLPGADENDLLQRGQLPVFIPNYYRGAWQQFPRTAGRSSQLFNTGTASWFYRIVIEQLFGVKGCPQGLEIQAKLPSDWNEASMTRDFRGARFNIHFRRVREQEGVHLLLDDNPIEGRIITEFEAGLSYDVEVKLGGQSN